MVAAAAEYFPAEKVVAPFFIRKPALGIDCSKDKLNLQTVQQVEHEEKLRSIQDSKRHEKLSPP